MTGQIPKGITQVEAEHRLAQYGPNRLPEKPPERCGVRFCGSSKVP
jgi:magnesium-transporting ATPase (P-type)